MTYRLKFEATFTDEQTCIDVLNSVIAETDVTWNSFRKNTTFTIDAFTDDHPETLDIVCEKVEASGAGIEAAGEVFNMYEYADSWKYKLVDGKILVSYSHSENPDFRRDAHWD